MHRTMPPPPTRGPARSVRRPWIIVAALVLVGGLAACQPVSRTSAGGGGLWTSKADLIREPMSGPAWTNVVKVANGGWGSPSLSDNNATHDTSTLAGAFVAVRTGNPAMYAKTRAGIMSVTRVTSFSRVLELSRNITSYVVAADLVGLPATDNARFRSFISGLRNKELEGHSGGHNLNTTALLSPNNWGAMSRAAMVAIDLYLGDRINLGLMANTYRAWLGEARPNTLRWSATGWHSAGTPAGINRRGARVMGRNVDGVEPEDQRRTGGPSTAPAPKGTYPWEALQGALVTGVLLDRAGIVPITAGDHALQRAFNWLYNVNGNPATADDSWQPWVLNHVSGTHFGASAARSPGKNMAWSDWTHR